jgi:leader peptidase (prepilin peptidase) / N-methyltransferase
VSAAPIEELATGPGAYVLAFVLGALLGIFANVCILRIPRRQSIVRPPSHCGACGAPVRWFDNLPIVSFLVLRGRCRACGAAFSPRYLLVEAATALLVLAVYHLCMSSLRPEDELSLRLMRFAVYTLFVWTLVVIAFIDLDHKKIPDRITYPAIPVFFAFGVLLGDVPLLDQAIGVVAGYGTIRLISDGYYWLTRREGLGYGDGKLLALVGALLGWRGVLFALFGGSLMGTLLAVPAILLRRRREPRAGGEAAPRGEEAEGEGDDAPPLRHVELPFGPFLAAGAVAYLFLEEVVRVGLGGW